MYLIMVLKIGRLVKSWWLIYNGVWVIEKIKNKYLFRDKINFKNTRVVRDGIPVKNKFPVRDMVLVKNMYRFRDIKIVKNKTVFRQPQFKI